MCDVRAYLLDVFPGALGRGGWGDTPPRMAGCVEVGGLVIVMEDGWATR